MSVPAPRTETAPPPPARPAAEGRPARGLVAGAATALLVAVVFGWAQGLAGPDGHELGYWALAIGLLVGAALGKAGGRAPALAPLGTLLALLGVLLAQLLAAATHMNEATSDAMGHPPGVLATLVHHFGAVVDYWRHEMLGRNDIAFYAVAGAEGYLVAKRVAE
ncbi:hypothetical protein [Streptomyces varsoviensis]|uniref:Uncharacterized protein n=1 Tax=Streptomyces varsoviensis TaxID=67373 RepID=A0ABR5J8E8_9ACTN|nr:hypothetical protein [Streptomyces varsoviensis]KOG89675.1 hypothetical protein ADK38_12950 [Streptomyces varsoviensis]